jgi:hypothetical protein
MMPLIAGRGPKRVLTALICTACAVLLVMAARLFHQVLSSAAIKASVECALARTFDAPIAASEFSKRYCAP